MSTLLVLKFDSVGGAAQMRDRMLSLQKQQLITIEDAAIMWKDAARKQQAAAALRYTAFNAKELGCVDDVISEPEGGSHKDPACAVQMLDTRLQFHLAQLDRMPLSEMLSRRYDKFRNIAQFYTSSHTASSTPA